jgi:two-component system, OmpR family, phosphate regulon sensor histidine kinase PhoR
VPPTRESRGHRAVVDQQPTEEFIRRKAAELEAVFESLGDGLLVLNSSAFVVEANRAALALLGLGQKREILGPIATGLNARVTRTDGAPFGSEDIGLFQTLREGGVARAECVLRPELGGPRWIETVASPIRDFDGAILGAAIVARDVTHQRRHERDLGLIVSVTDGLMAAVDVGAALGGLAERCVQDLGDWCAVYQADDGSDLLRLAAMRQRGGRHGPELAALLAQRPARVGEGFAGAAVRAGETMLLPELTEETLRRRAGNGVEGQVARRLGLRSIVAAPLRGARGFVGALCVGWISDRRRPDDQDAHLVNELSRRASMALEQARCLRALEQSLERIELVLNSTGAGLFIFGGDGRAILVNATAREMIGLEGDGLGLTFSEILTPYEDQFENPVELDDIVIRAAELSQDSSGEFQLRLPEPIDVHWLAAPVRQVDGRVVGQIVIWVDVTHIRAAERVKDDLAADLSEALRLPLQSISTHAVQALRRGRRAGTDSLLLHGLEVILRNARQVSMHVNDLVDAARFDASTLALDVLEVEVQDVLQQAVDEARAMTTTHRFRVDVPPAVPPPRWDPDRVRQALLHVLSNAIKYWPEGGQITIKARPQLEGVVISVRDRGLGVPLREQERVFERYFRLAGDPARYHIRGNGLGLYLVRGVVEAHGGTVWIESTGVPGEGTTVHLLLPWLPAAQAR